MKYNLFSILLLSAFLIGCNDDDTIAPEEEVIPPDTYTFERDGNSSVDFNGQTTRILMASELTGSFNDFESFSEEKLVNMFHNENTAFSSEDLNNSDKSISSKVAASADYFASNQSGRSLILDHFLATFSSANDVYMNREVLATAGVAGQIAQGTRVRYVNEKGIEPNQLFAKSLIGALLTDQALNNYLSEAVLDAGSNVANNDEGVLEDGKNYTTMEHKWDEAYGYIWGQQEGNQLFNYINQVDEDPDFAGIAQSIEDAFILGRAAIVAKNYTVRDQQVEIIREAISKVIAVRAIHYLQSGKTALAEESYGSAFHSISEGIGFVYSLQFSQNPETNAPYLSAAQINDFMEDIQAGNGLWDVSAETLDEWSNTVSQALNIGLDKVTN